MWRWVPKNVIRRHPHRVLELVSDGYTKQFGDISQMIMDAVARYNEFLPVPRNFKGKHADERFVQEAEEESAQMFLNEIFDVVQRENTKSDYSG